VCREQRENAVQPSGWNFYRDAAITATEEDSESRRRLFREVLKMRVARCAVDGEGELTVWLRNWQRTWAEEGCGRRSGCSEEGKDEAEGQ